MTAAEFDNEVARVLGIRFVVDETIPDDPEPESGKVKVIDVESKFVKTQGKP